MVVIGGFSSRGEWLMNEESSELEINVLLDKTEQITWIQNDFIVKGV